MEVAGGGALQVGGGCLFKLEDVALGSWLDHVARSRGFDLHLVNDPRFSYSTGCHARCVTASSSALRGERRGVNVCEFV
jgi:hypothetical protein